MSRIFLSIKTSSLTFDRYEFWNCKNLETINYYGLSEPIYKAANSCSASEFGCSTGNCYPFRCNVNNLSIVYVPTTYTSQTDTFCGKEVTVSKTLQI